MPGESGRCHTRINRGGNLYSLSYGVLSAISSDPVEKKPLYHFFPGKPVLSVGSFGCNFRCDFCQNCDISQTGTEIFSQYPTRSPDDLVDTALSQKGNIGLAYTYNEPSINFEYILECAAGIRKVGLKNVMVTNGYVNKEPLGELLGYVDAFNIDLKSFRNEFYQDRSEATLAPVLDTISRVARSGAHLELTFLLIPGQNDSEEEWKDMIHWIRMHCGPDAILHVSKYFPRFKLRSTPTPTESLRRFISMAREQIHYVYPGNTQEISDDTCCPGCGTLLLERDFYTTRNHALDPDGRCRSCGERIYGQFK
jgi:pyruvate formate lyase activating enzyme